MILYEYDEALHMKTERQLGREEGMLEGMLEGMEQGLKAGTYRQMIASIERIMAALGIGLKEACDILGTDVETYYEAKRLGRG